MTPTERRLAFARALGGWADAAARVRDLWPRDAPDMIAGYPDYLPSFDEHVNDIEAFIVATLHAWAKGGLCEVDDEGRRCVHCGAEVKP